MVREDRGADRASADPYKQSARVFTAEDEMKRYTPRQRSLESLVIGARTDRRPPRPVSTSLVYCQASLDCQNVATGWLRVNGKAIRACGPCRGGAR
jgi:hypothetical protein